MTVITSADYDKMIEAALMVLVKEGKLVTYKKKGVRYWVERRQTAQARKHTLTAKEKP